MTISFKKSISAVILLCAAGIALFMQCAKKDGIPAGQAESASIGSMIQSYTDERPGVKLTIGLLKADQTSFAVLGADSEKLEPVEYEYEIGSISKTFTASMLCKAVTDGKIGLEDSIAKYLPLDSDAFFPTVRSLATHTSGYGEYPFDSSALSDQELEKIDEDFHSRRLNIYRGLNRAVILNQINMRILKDKQYGWEYSNFGYAVLGTVLGDVNQTDFRTAAENFMHSDLGLANTHFGDGAGNLDHYWSWNQDDAYLAAGGIVSTVTDLLKYGRAHLNDTPSCLALSHKAYQTFEKDGFSMGLGWIIDSKTGYIWHNGGTSSFTSFLGIDKEHQIVVVILSNYPENDEGEEGALDRLGFALLGCLGKGGQDVFHALA